MAFVAWVTQFDIAHTCIFHHVLEALGVFVGYLNHHTWVLGKENLHEVGLCYLIEVEFHTTFHIGKAHLQQGCNQTTSRDIVTSHDDSLADELLDSIEGIAEVVGIGNGWHIVAYLIERLCKG